MHDIPLVMVTVHVICWNSQSEEKSLYSVLGGIFCSFSSGSRCVNLQTENETHAGDDRIEKWKEPGALMMSPEPLRQPTPKSAQLLAFLFQEIRVLIV